MLTRSKLKPGRKRRKMTSVRRKRLERNRLERELDEFTRQQVYERDLACKLRIAKSCTIDRDLQWCHVITREEKILRWDSLNSLIGCRNCHCLWHTNTTYYLAMFARLYPERWEHIQRVLSGVTHFGLAEIQELHAKTFGAARIAEAK